MAERAGTSAALVIYYFKNKGNLLTEAMRYAGERWFDLEARRMEAIDSAASRVEEIVTMTCLPDPDAALGDSWVLWLDLWAQSVRHPEVARLRAEFDAHRRVTIAGVVRDGQSSGELGEVDADDFAVTLSALLDGFAVQIALGDQAVDPRRAFVATMGFVEHALGFSCTSKKNDGSKAGRKTSS